MRPTAAGLVGFTCRYAPLPLIHAAGLIPYRMLPLTEAPDSAGAVPEALSELAQREVDLLVVNGGDGTLQLVTPYLVQWRQLAMNQQTIRLDHTFQFGSVE